MVYGKKYQDSQLQLHKGLNSLQKRFRRYKCTGIVIFAIFCILSGILFCLNQYWILVKKQSVLYFAMARAGLDIMGSIYFVIILCMLYSAVSLLRRLVNDNSEEGSDNTVAVLHFLLVIAFIQASLFESIVRIVFFVISTLQNGKSISFEFNYGNFWAMVENLNKTISYFISFMILLFMFWRYTLLQDVLKQDDLEE